MPVTKGIKRPHGYDRIIGNMNNILTRDYRRTIRQQQYSHPLPYIINYRKSNDPPGVRACYDSAPEALHLLDSVDCHIPRSRDDAGAAVEALAEHLAGRDDELRVDVLVDNAGFELIGDLAVADYLLATGKAARLVLHVKLHPTFVSDATDRDVRQTVDYLASFDQTAMRAVGARLRGELDAERLLLTTDAYWTSPLPGWEMPPAVYQDLADARLVISKGDANYRRLLGDSHWPLETPFADIVSYFPTAVLALRTYKSEVGCGLPAGRQAALMEEDPTWQVNGKWGIIQMAKGRSPQAGR